MSVQKSFSRRIHVAHSAAVMSRVVPAAAAAAVVGIGLVALSRTRRRCVAEQQVLGPTALPCAISWTGGKDCNLALLAAWRDPSLRVVALVVFRPEDAAFLPHPIPPGS